MSPLILIQCNWPRISGFTVLQFWGRLPKIKGRNMSLLNVVLKIWRFKFSAQNLVIKPNGVVLTIIGNIFYLVIVKNHRKLKHPNLLLPPFCFGIFFPNSCASSLKTPSSSSFISQNALLIPQKLPHILLISLL